MQTMPGIYKPVSNIGYFLLGLGICGLLALSTITGGLEKFEKTFLWAFFGPLSFYHLMAGIGLILRRKWALRPLKAYLYFKGLGLASRWALRYMDENQIDMYLK